jgi:trimethylamine--corrinoid protein Co-methyltransferase
MIDMLRRYLRGFEVIPDTLAYDVIAKVGHDGHFLGEAHTLERCRTEFWKPDLADRSGLETRNAESWRDTASRARQRWGELLSKHQDPPLDSLVARQLKAYVEKNTQKSL